MPLGAGATMTPSPHTEAHSSYSDKQLASSIDQGIEVVATSQPYPDAYAYANPDNDSSRGGGGGGGGGDLEVVDDLLSNDNAKPAWSARNPKRRICDLSRRNLIIAIAVATALAVAAIIGGSVGGVLANKSSSGSAQADAVKSTSLAPAITQGSAIATNTVAAVTSTSEPVTSTSISSSLATSTPVSSSSVSTTVSSSPVSTSTTSTSSASTPTSSEGSYNCPSDNNKSYVSSLLTSETWTILCDTDWPSGVDSISGGTVVDLTAIVAYSIEGCIDQCAAYNVAGGSCEAVVYGANITLALSRGGVQGNCFLKSEPGATNTLDSSGQVEAAYLTS
ncbi:hypothetical protein PV04_02688 [Phialophora macrospora]|uniref:Apple domain-containing protein n=1 Tax=Phialophora macrospora TaxID=1851006 RepID=A0A0D2E7X9_9EURO|nr:hypothetical protein PV04_02688 [Phialophora macrospora]